MKKKSALLVVLLSAVCLICALIGLTACNGDKDTVIKVGETDIGTVTSEGLEFGVKGEEGTSYTITVKTGDDVCNGITIGYGDLTGDGTLNIVYSKDYKLKFTATTGEIENVTVVMEKYVIPQTFNCTLTADEPVVLQSINKGDSVMVSVATEEGKTYTVRATAGTGSVVVAGKQGTNETFPYIFDGKEYVDFNNVATFRVISENGATNVTLTLSIIDTPDDGGDGDTSDYDVMNVGATTVTEFPDTDQEGDPAHYYTFVVDADTTYKVTADGYVSFIGENDSDTVMVDGSWGKKTQTVTLKAGTYTVMVVDYNNGAAINITISEAND